MKSTIHGAAKGKFAGNAARHVSTKLRVFIDWATAPFAQTLTA